VAPQRGPTLARRRREAADPGRKGEHADQDDELRAGQVGDQDRDQGQRIGPTAGRDEGPVHRQKRPHRRGIGERLGQEDRREGDPGNGDRHGGGKQRESTRHDDPAREKEHRDGGACHEQHVQDVRRLKGRGHVHEAEERGQQQRIEEARRRAVAPDLRRKLPLAEADGELRPEDLVRHQRPRRDLADRKPACDGGQDDDRCERRGQAAGGRGRDLRCHGPGLGLEQGHRRTG
jgi:hypothetical protein